jgi:hypothetical protein
MFEWLGYTLTWAWDHMFVVLAAGGVIFLIVMGFQWSLRYGLKAVLIVGVAVMLMGCFLGVGIGSLLLTAEVSEQLPSLLCTNLQFCPPENIPGSTSTPPDGAGDWPVGYTYEVSHSSGSATLRNGSAVDSAVIAEIANGTDLCIAEFVASNTIDGRTLRARVVPGGDNTTMTGWVHTAALASKPLKKCP